MKKTILLSVVGLIFTTTNALTGIAQEVIETGISRTSTLPVTRVSESTDGNYNFRSFEIETTGSGAYYTEFWLLPAKYVDNSYTRFLIYVNDNYIGTISPSNGNWQSARIDGHEKINLSEGVNVITVATIAPEFPEVETVKVSLNDSDAAFSTDAYEYYLNECAAGVMYDEPDACGAPMLAGNNTDTGIIHYSNVPLNYTFYKTFEFTNGQEVFITTSSHAPHKLDIVYYGSIPERIDPVDPIVPDYPNTIGSTNTNAESTNSTVLPPSPKFSLPYTHATSEEMQGLGWVYPSQKSNNSTVEVAVGRFDIYKTGQYLVRIRHAEDGGSAVADVNVNGTYYYEDIPITYSYRECEIPADGIEYATMTRCYNTSTDDSYLFIHGANCDRIVGFNDDVSISQKQQLGLSTWDSYISQKYFVKTTGISVCNYSSSNPRSYCDIIARVSGTTTRSAAKSRERGTETAGVSATSILDESVIISGPDNINGMLTISADENIRNVSVFGIAGNCLWSANNVKSCFVIPVSSLNITERGIYIVRVETKNGIASKKIVIK